MWSRLSLLLLAVAKVHAGPEQDTWDYIVVGTGPGGATAARLLALNAPSWEILVLEAGEDRDTDEPIMNSRYASVVADQYFPQYSWQAAQLFNNVSSGDDQLTGGRLMGGSSSINGQQWVRPSKQFLQQLFLASGEDADWRPSHVYDMLKKIERFDGPAYLERGKEGPIPVRWSPPESLRLSPHGTEFMSAVRSVFSSTVNEVTDYNNPDAPLGYFARWQLSQFPNGRRGSSSVGMLTRTVRDLPNMTIKTRTTAVRVLFEGKKATSVVVVESGDGKVLKARKGIIISAGHRSSLLLENSGIGNPEIIQPLLTAAKMPFVEALPGVGENLGNDGVVIATMEVPEGEKSPLTAFDLYSAGAFLPYPKGPAPSTGSMRFSQWFTIDPMTMSADHRRSLRSRILEQARSGRARRRQLHGDEVHGGDEEEEMGPKILSIGMILLNVTSRGFAHIQSADPLHMPLVTTRLLQDDKDMQRWVTLLKKQLYPIAEAMENKGYLLLSPDPTLFDAHSEEETGGGHRKAKAEKGDKGRALAGGHGGGGDMSFETLEEFVAGTYVHAHHWFGTCRMGPREKNAVVDSAGKVHGVTGLYVADASIFPIKPDGNTQVPAYIAGAIVAEKILKAAELL